MTSKKYDGFIKITHGTSRGRDTYGYNLVTAIDSTTGKRFQECGGGYDMVGSAMGRWLASTLQSEFKSYLESFGMSEGDYCHSGDMARENNWPYGAGISLKGNAFIDGACGFNEIRKALNGMGYTIESVGYNNRLRRYVHEGYRVYPTEQ